MEENYRECLKHSNQCETGETTDFCCLEDDKELAVDSPVGFSRACAVQEPGQVCQSLCVRNGRLCRFQVRSS
ncbi:hypothetical protein V5799_029761 [Amblyomma americanum]|uniref:Uncharacterized protein n=1 Tax=Amblyomma americanum TaxID=6943 RepID=A0AAQ4EQS7_AMBAM